MTNLESGGAEQETFRDFKDSFFYGTRTDLLFKALADLRTERAAEFFRRLLQEIGNSFDTGQWQEIINLVYEMQIEGYGHEGRERGAWSYETAPFARLPRPLSESTVALLSSGGHFVDGDDPSPFGVEDMSQETAVSRIRDFLRAEPELAEIPVDTPARRLHVRHPGYDVRGAARDPEVVLPIGALRKAETDGRIGRLHPTAFSFVGAAAQVPLRDRVAPGWAGRFRDAGIEAVLMVPV